MKIKRPNKIVEGVHIYDTSSEGLAVARVDELVVFVEGAVPGDICTIQINRVKKKFGEAKMIKLETPSPYRTDDYGHPRSRMRLERTESCQCRLKA